MEKEEFKFYLHEYARQELKAHTRSKKWHTIKDKDYINKLESEENVPSYIRQDNKGNYEIDISGCTYEYLTPEIQKYYEALAKVVEIIEEYSKMKKSSYTINQEAEIIYNDWLSRNPQVQNKTYLTTFNKLPKGLQGFLKYASILGKKIAKSNYRYSLASTAHELIDDIENFGIRANKNFYFDYCGARFYTAIDTADSVYLKLTGLTQDEYLDALRHIKLNTKNSLTETHKKIFRSVRYKEKRKFCEFVLELFESGKSDEEIFNELYSGKYTEKLEELEDKNLQAYLYLISKTTILNGNKKSLHRFTVDKKKGYYVAYNNARMESQRQEIKNLVKEYNPEKEF